MKIGYVSVVDLSSLQCNDTLHLDQSLYITNLVAESIWSSQIDEQSSSSGPVAFSASCPLTVRHNLIRI